MDQEAHIAQLQRTAQQRARAYDAWRAAILAAHQAGMSYRQIALHAGVSHSRVQQIVNGTDGG